MKLMSINDARDQGFMVYERAPGRPIAYKGPLFNPTEWHECQTAVETELLKALESMTFVVETVAHLRGLEKELLPCAEQARQLIKTTKGE